MANSTSVPAILPCMEEVLSSSSKIIIRDMYSELQASVKLSDEDRDKAQMHLLERMLFEAGEDRTGHVALGFASHPVLQMGFTNAVRDAITPELAAIVNWRVLARLLPLAHKAPEDSITWRAMGECWVHSCQSGDYTRTVYGSFGRVYFARMAGQKLPNDSTCFENMIHLWHGMIQEYLCPSVSDEEGPEGGVMYQFEDLVETTLSLLACYGAFSVGKVVLRALSTFTLESSGVPLWKEMKGEMNLWQVMAAYLNGKFAYPPFTSDKAGKQFGRLWKLLGGKWEIATDVYASDSPAHSRLYINTAHSPSRVLSLLHAVLRERGEGGLKKFLNEKAAFLSEKSPKCFPRYFVFLLRCLLHFQRLTRRWFNAGVRELLSAGEVQHRMHPVSAREIMQASTLEMCHLIDFIARFVPDFGKYFVASDEVSSQWKKHIALFELRSWQHGFVSNILAAFCLCQNVMEAYLGAASHEFVGRYDFRHDSSDEDEYGVPKMTRGNTLRPQDAAWVLDLLSDNKIKAHDVARHGRKVEFERAAPFMVSAAGPLLGRAEAEAQKAKEHLTNFAMKPLACFGVHLLQHLHRHHGVSIPLALRTFSNSGPPTVTDVTACTYESALGVNSPDAWGGSLSWVARRAMVLRRVAVKTDAQAASGAASS